MFRTQVEIPHSPIKITYEDRVMTLGSCFSENIGNKMQDAYFLMDNNPFGVLYNPISIRNSIDLMLQNKRFTEEDLFLYQSMYHSFAHSGMFSDTTAEGCLKKINSRVEVSCDFLQQANFLLITFGTAWVFEDEKTGKIVSNCHKLPSTEFVRRRLTVQEIVGDYIALIHKMNTLFPNLQIIFSVSPIRHWKDGAHENNISKSTLHLAIDALQKYFLQVHYFPAFEIQLDELRDYRFYDADMFHPTDLAIDYIWKRFSDTYFSQKTQQLKKRLEQLALELAHRPLHPESIEYSYFLYKVEKHKSEIRTEFPLLADRIK